MKSLEDKVAVVTGGGSGIGAAIAKQLDQAGAKIVLFGRDRKKLENTAQSLKHSHLVSGDVTKLSDLETLFQETKTAFGKVDVLIANAGVAMRKHLEEVDEAFFDYIVNTDYKGLYFTVQKAAPHLNKGASVVLISSAAGSTGFPSHSVYSSTKAAVSHLARGFSADLIQRGIRVNAVSPGFTDTPIFDQTPPEKLEAISKSLAIGRFASAEEVAHVACFLASPLSSYVVGANFVVDGGLSTLNSPPQLY